MSDVNFTMVRGDTDVRQYQITRDGSAVDLTGATIRVTGKEKLSDADGSAVFSLSSPASGIIIDDAVQGILTVTIAPVDTSSLNSNTSLYWDMQVTESNGRVSTPIRGRIEVVQDVTQTSP